MPSETIHISLLNYIRKMIEEALSHLQIPASHIVDDGTEVRSSGIAGATVGGDLRGTLPNPNVKGLQGRPISVDEPTSGQVLTWLDADVWGPADPTGGSGGGGTDLPDPTAVGQFLVSLDATTWTPVFIVTDPDVGILFDDEGRIVVSS